MGRGDIPRFVDVKIRQAFKDKDSVEFVIQRIYLFNCFELGNVFFEKKVYFGESFVTALHFPPPLLLPKHLLAFLGGEGSLLKFCPVVMKEEGF